MTDDIIQRAREALQRIDDLNPNPTADPFFDVVDSALDLAERLQKRNVALASDRHKIVAGVIGPRPMCRDCADEDGACPHNDGLPCDTTDEIIERFKRLQQDNARLRTALIAVVNDGTDGFASDSVSTDFLSHVPTEARAVKVERDKLKSENARLVKERDEAFNARDSQRKKRWVSAKAARSNAAGIKVLKEALGQISRMRCFPDAAINMTTLTAAIRISQKALGESE